LAKEAQRKAKKNAREKEERAKEKKAAEEGDPIAILNMKYKSLLTQVRQKRGELIKEKECEKMRRTPTSTWSIAESRPPRSQTTNPGRSRSANCREFFGSFN